MKEQLLALENVVGVGRGWKKHGLHTTVVLVEKKKPLSALATSQVVPKFFEGRQTDVIEVGRIIAQGEPKGKWRPAPGGVSIGHYKVSAGTLGAPVIHKTTNTRMMLSNNHVLANSNDAELQDMILQPGTADGGSIPEDLIAELHSFVEIYFNQNAPTCNLTKAIVKASNAVARVLGSAHRLDALKVSNEINYVDAALAKPLDPQDLDDHILQVGKISGMLNHVELGEKVHKSGRTTGYTEGEIILLDTTISVNYGGGKVATFMEQIVTTGMSAPGDSGSLGVVFVGGFAYAFGLLFAGSEGPTGVTIYNPIGKVAERLNFVFAI